jgi:hypothetical protein
LKELPGQRLSVKGIDLFDFASTRKAKYVSEMTANPRM